MSAQAVDLVRNHGFTAAEAEAMNSGQFRATWMRAPPQIHEPIAGTVEGRTVGWIHLLVRQDRIGVLESLFIHPEERDRGYARELVRGAIARAKAKWSKSSRSSRSTAMRGTTNFGSTS